MPILLLPCTLIGIIFSGCNLACALSAGKTLDALNRTVSNATAAPVVVISNTVPPPTTESPTQIFDGILKQLELETKAVRVDKYDLNNANNLFYVGANILLVALLAGYFFQLVLESFFPQCMSPERPSTWVFVGLLGMYGLLISSWFADLFIDIRLLTEVRGHLIYLTSSPPGIANAISGTTLDFIRLLPPGGSTFLVLCQMVFPQVALVLFLVGEFLRNGEHRDTSRRCTLTAMAFCKLCCPIMFAEILGLHLFLQMQEGNIYTDGAWDFGFTGSCIFCMSTVVLCCFIKPASLDDEERPLTWGSSRFFAGLVRPKSSMPWMLELLGKQGTFYATVSLTFLFIALIGIGIAYPFIGAQLTENILIQPHGPFPDYALPWLTGYVKQWKSANDSLATAIAASTLYLFDGGQANSFLAFLALFVFAVLCPVVGMLVTSIAAYKMSRERRIRDQLESQQAREIVDVGGDGAMVARALKHCDMLDVCIVGIFILIFASISCSSQGFEVYCEWSIMLLILAELTHYFTHFAVVPAIEYVQSNPGEALG